MTELLVSKDLKQKAQRVIDALTARGEMLVTAESCTGGLIAGTLTAVAGSSSAVFGGFVTYSNNAKIEMLGVAPDMLGRFGAVSAETAHQMADGARDKTGCAWSIAVTGVAGPGGGSEEKPVGLVWFGLSSPTGTRTEQILFDVDGRDAIRSATVDHALTMLIDALD